MSTGQSQAAHEVNLYHVRSMLTCSETLCHQALAVIFLCPSSSFSWDIWLLSSSLAVCGTGLLGVQHVLWHSMHNLFLTVDDPTVLHYLAPTHCNGSHSPTAAYLAQNHWPQWSFFQTPNSSRPCHHPLLCLAYWSGIQGQGKKLCRQKCESTWVVRKVQVGNSWGTCTISWYEDDVWWGSKG